VKGYNLCSKEDKYKNVPGFPAPEHGYFFHMTHFSSFTRPVAPVG